MGASLKLLTLQKKQEIIDYILSKNQNGEKKASSRTWNLKRTAQSYEIHGEKLFIKRGNRLLEVICSDETEKIHSILQSIHLPGHRGIFFYKKNLLCRNEKNVVRVFLQVLWCSTHFY